MQRALRQQTASQQSIGYDDAQYICLLIPIQEQADILWVDELYHRLEKDGKTCFILGFSELEVVVPDHPNLLVLTPETLTWHLIPKENAIKSLISTNFDLLLNLCTDDRHLALDYAALKIQATWRIGRYEPTLANAYGLMVKGEHIDSKALLHTIKHYLSKIQ